ncbi:MAG: S-methyl-5'-thioadenosine phosphorylase [Microgenomates group bacterium]|jgi:5'-methylthioadenosine phosphorylase
MKQSEIIVGIIGGSGMDDPQILDKPQTQVISTPFGKPSDKLLTGKINGKKVIILPRHNKKHSLNPTNVPYRANIWALKEVGCTHILATTACGSLKEKFVPGDLAFPNQFIDFTKLRNLTFFNDKVVHTAMADPFDKDLRLKLAETAKKLKLKHHKSGTIITIEGPRFSTRAESKMFQLLGADLINMSTVPEVILAAELNIPYQSIAMVTDYDCWREGEESVSFEMILERMKENTEKVKILLIEVIKAI